MEIPNKRHLAILNAKLIAWQNTCVDAGDDIAIAQHIDNKQMETVATERMKQALQAVRWIEERITELEKPIDKLANP